MSHIYLCFVWHMHQPFYKDLATGEYKLPWTRMHGLKDYYGMVKVLEDFPDVHQTFNLVPSMMVQIEEYADAKAYDPFLRAALKPAEELNEAEKKFILQYFFQANVGRMVYRYPRYKELYEAASRAGRFMSAQDFRDLQVLSQVAWFDEEFHDNDKDVKYLVERGRDYTLEDQALMGRKQVEFMKKVLPVYADFAAKGQIELSTTPFYHPILPLLCDSDIGGVSHPHVPLPTRFRYPDDARHQLEQAYAYMSQTFGQKPAGLWPSEGSVSNEALMLAADAGYKWFATDNGVLTRTLGHVAGVLETYKPYVWRHNGREMRCIFRDHYLSDLIGFVYSRMGPAEAASHFLDRIRENCGGRTSLVPIILDGENAWEYYELSGRPFLRELYRRISEDPSMTALTVSEAFDVMEPTELTHIFPGSWINANFDVWIGAEEDNRAWEYLLRARQTYERLAPKVSEDQRKLAFEELLIAEGSDWNWWYGPEHDSANRPEFDQLYRDHLANIYRALGEAPPDELSRSILKCKVTEFHERPTSLLKPTIDGEVTSYFEWMGAGLYHIDQRSGAMHGQRFLLKEMHYGTDGETLFVRLDFERSVDPGELEIRLKTPALDILLDDKDFVFRKVLEFSVPMSKLGCRRGETAMFQLSIWQNGLPMDALPQQGWIEVTTFDEWPI